MKRIGPKLLIALLAGFLLLLPATGGWADDEVPEEEIVEEDPGFALSVEEESAVYSEGTVEVWNEWEDTTTAE